MLTMVRDIDIFDEGFNDAMFKVVLNMIADGMSYEIISKYCELSLEEIEYIREENLGFTL